MNEIVNKFLLAGVSVISIKFMSEMHFRQPELMLVDHLQRKTKESIALKKQRDSSYIYQNELDKACFQHDVT